MNFTPTKNWSVKPRLVGLLTKTHLNDFRATPKLQSKCLLDPKPQFRALRVLAASFLKVLRGALKL